MKPAPTEYAPYYDQYIRLIDETDFLPALQNTHTATQHLLQGIPEEKGNYAYAPGKWTVKQVLAHLIDTERVFACRALHLARKHTLEMPGFDHEAWALNSGTAKRSIKEMADEFACVRQSTILLYKGFTPEMLNEKGMANNMVITVLSLAFTIPGHEKYHLQVLKERYV